MKSKAKPQCGEVSASVTSKRKRRCAAPTVSPEKSNLYVYSKKPKVSEDCGVCMDLIKTKGKLNSCEHNFCYDCIVKWTKRSSTCPLCKRNVSHITKIEENQKASVHKVRRKHLRDTLDREHQQNRARILNTIRTRRSAQVMLSNLQRMNFAQTSTGFTQAWTPPPPLVVPVTPPPGRISMNTLNQFQQSQHTRHMLQPRMPPVYNTNPFQTQDQMVPGFNLNMNLNQLNPPQQVQYSHNQQQQQPYQQLLDDPLLRGLVNLNNIQEGLNVALNMTRSLVLLDSVYMQPDLNTVFSSLGQQIEQPAGPSADLFTMETSDDVIDDMLLNDLEV